MMEESMESVMQEEAKPILYEGEVDIVIRQRKKDGGTEVYTELHGCALDIIDAMADALAQVLVKIKRDTSIANATCAAMIAAHIEGKMNELEEEAKSE